MLAEARGHSDVPRGPQQRQEVGAAEYGCLQMRSASLQRCRKSFTEGSSRGTWVNTHLRLWGDLRLVRA